MFLIRKIFENDLTLIFKIEGEITDVSLDVWADEISALKKQSERQIILVFSSVSYMSPKAIEKLVELWSNNIYLLDCTIFIRNMLHTAGLSANLLD